MSNKQQVFFLMQMEYVHLESPWGYIHACMGVIPSF